MIYGLLGNNSVKENNNWKHPISALILWTVIHLLAYCKTPGFFCNPILIRRYSGLSTAIPDMVMANKTGMPTIFCT